jgi:predicted nucleic acid-binding protein
LKVKFIFDASPLIHLTKTGLNPLIAALEGEKYTVPAVFDEVVRKGIEMGYSDAASTASLVDEGVLEVEAPQKKKVTALARFHKDIHAGETEVIALAKEMSAIAVIDDHVARTVAKIEGVRVEGSYGVILRAAARGSISREEGEDALERLVASGWRCDAELYAALLRSLREIAGRQSAT